MNPAQNVGLRDRHLPRLTAFGSLAAHPRLQVRGAQDGGGRLAPEFRPFNGQDAMLESGRLFISFKAWNRGQTRTCIVG